MSKFVSVFVQGLAELVCTKGKIVFCRPFSGFATEGQYKDSQVQHWHKNTKLQQEVITLFAII